MVAFDLLEHQPDPPHTEGWIVDERYRIEQAVLPAERRRELLRRLDAGSVAQVFGTTIHHHNGWFVRLGEGRRSLGTIRAAAVLSVEYRYRRAWTTWSYRLHFTDGDGQVFGLAVTDLAFRSYLADERTGQQRALSRIERQMLTTFREADEVYLRLGFARG